MLGAMQNVSLIPPASTVERPTLDTPTVEIVIPVYNEEADLEQSVRRLHRYLEEEFPFSFQITIADNASRDRTWGIASILERELPQVSALHFDEKGRGRALRAAWAASDAAVVAYMDVDLSTDLDALLPLVAPLLSGHSDVAIGTRLARSSRVERGLKREPSSYTWDGLAASNLVSAALAATSSSMTAAPIELATGQAVMSLGGFNGNSQAITLARFKQLVAAGRIHYYIAGGMGGGGTLPSGAASGSSSSSSEDRQRGFGGNRSNGRNEIALWVASNFTAKTVAGTTIYDLGSKS